MVLNRISKYSNCIVSFGYWFISLIPPPAISKEQMQRTTTSELSYLSENAIPFRGKILAIVTSSPVMGSTEKSTGFELTELARTYYVFQANGLKLR